MDNILIIHPGPLGQHTGTLFYCKFLKNNFLVNYVGIDEGFGSVVLEDIEATHLKPTKNTLIRKIKYFKLAIKIIKQKKYKFILVNYFPLCSLLLFFNRSLVVEIRTSYIFKSKLRRLIYNFVLTNEVKLFKNITTLTKSLSEYLKLPKRTKIIPLGGPLINKRKINFQNLKFLYVGTFKQRNIHLTIEAFSIFLHSLNIKKDTLGIEIQYHIVGFGDPSDIEKIKQYIEIFDLSKYVIFHGEVRYPDLEIIFNNCNIGISYVPMFDYFQRQPVTKTCEYLLNGMPVIATRLNEHLQLINSENGVLINDNIAGLTKGFSFIFENRLNFSSERIQIKANTLSWNYIINQILIPFINDI